ncbi:hypothetical protein PNIG_a3029 [Pseudoalteromonas nigrifaciens]|uniref:Uncharacterized protein n=1 Tax=Pseudoalteromonas nigrifaciens TaxID=28109 RepID=A0AAC9XYM7_9GAMM|nr:hypothetical protein PNIG_a3029 [Pseudoalteromonas nigrifaciens]
MVAKSTFPPKVFAFICKRLLLIVYRQDTELLKPFFIDKHKKLD